MPTTSLLAPYISADQRSKYATHNSALDILDDAIAGMLSKSVAGSSNVTLTDAESQHMIMDLTGILTGSINVIVPTRPKMWLVINSTTGAYTLTVKTSAGTGIAVDQGEQVFLYCDGVNVEEALSAVIATNPTWDSSPDTDHTYSGPEATMTIDAGESPAFGMLLTLASDGELVLTDADTDTLVPAMYMATGSGTGSQTVILPGAYVRDDTWNWTPGSQLYVSATTGAITATAPSGSGQQVNRIGHAVTADIIFFNPSSTVIEIT